MPSWFSFGRSSEQEPAQEKVIASSPLRVRSTATFNVAAGIPDIIADTNKFTSSTNYDNNFDIYDAMVKFDPELNGAVRSVSLTGNNYSINYKSAKNARIREGIRMLVEKLPFDDILINAIRNLIVYGNDINKIVGKAGVGITDLTSLPIKQMTISDSRGAGGKPFAANEQNYVATNDFYTIREGQYTQQTFPKSEVMHFRIDYRSNWFTDSKSRVTYGVWGASRFTSLEQPIRAKYNSMNNRIALEDVLTKQYISIDKSAIEHITDPDEQAERLGKIMDEVISLFEGLDGDEMPILPSYITLHHVDLNNTIPDNSGFLDTVGSNIAAVLHVPRVAAGQERGSTFAATYNANMWANTAISRLQQVVVEGVHELFSLHLTLLGIEHKMSDLPKFEFEPIAEESPTERMRRATMGYDSGIITRNQALEIIGLPTEKDGNQRTKGKKATTGRLPREGEQE